MTTFQEITHPDDLVADMEFMRQLLEGRIRNFTMEKRYFRKNGSTVWVNLTVSPMWKEGEQPNFHIAVANDITENKQAGEALRQRTEELEVVNKELEAFSYSVSHDLRSPLRAIEGFSQMVMEDYVDKLDDEGRRLFGVIQKNTQKMSQLIDDLLLFARFGKQEIRLSNINMEKLGRNVFEELKPLLSERKIQFGLNGPPSVQGDHAMIRQVLVNLLSNAIKFTRPRETASIEVGGSNHGDENIYYVKDNGVGFDMQYVNKLFGVFQRLHNSEEFEGTGVGLAIVQRIIHRHGGRVWAEGKVGEGTSFYFSLPAKK